MTDSFEVYIINRKTGAKVPALAAPAKRVDAIGLKGKGWSFDWRIPFKDGQVVYKITSDGVLQGLIAFEDDLGREAVYIVDLETAPDNRFDRKGKYHVTSALLAIAAKYSFQVGEEGYIFFEAKTNLINYYMRKHKARLTMPPQGMGIFPDRSQELICEYIAGGISNEDK